MSVTALQPFEVPLRGVSLVEAAAGTGKNLDDQRALSETGTRV